MRGAAGGGCSLVGLNAVRYQVLKGGDEAKENRYTDLCLLCALGPNIAPLLSSPPKMFDCQSLGAACGPGAAVG